MIDDHDRSVLESTGWTRVDDITWVHRSGARIRQSGDEGRWHGWTASNGTPDGMTGPSHHCPLTQACRALLDQDVLTVADRDDYDPEAAERLLYKLSEGTK